MLGRVIFLRIPVPTTRDQANQQDDPFKQEQTRASQQRGAQIVDALHERTRLARKWLQGARNIIKPSSTKLLIQSRSTHLTTLKLYTGPQAIRSGARTALIAKIKVVGRKAMNSNAATLTEVPTPNNWTQND